MNQGDQQHKSKAMVRHVNFFDMLAVWDMEWLHDVVMKLA